MEPRSNHTKLGSVFDGPGRICLIPVKYLSRVPSGSFGDLAEAPSVAKRGRHRGRTSQSVRYVRGASRQCEYKDA